MPLVQLKIQRWPQRLQSALSAFEHRQFAALDVGLDEIEPVQPECRNALV
jgi:hypothetical protein